MGQIRIIQKYPRYTKSESLGLGPCYLISISNRNSLPWSLVKTCLNIPILLPVLLSQVQVYLWLHMGQEC